MAATGPLRGIGNWVTKRLAADRPSLSLVAVLAAPSVGAAGLRIDRVFARFHRPATPARVV